MNLITSSASRCLFNKTLFFPIASQRWARRKSRLASLKGFKYFQLMRRVELDPSNPAEHLDRFDYVSLTIWNEKRDFNAWRKVRMSMK